MILTKMEYTHSSKKRINNPSAGQLGNIDKTEDGVYDASLISGGYKQNFDAQNIPSLEWKDKHDIDQIKIETVPLHIHESIQPAKILNSVMNNKQSVMSDFFEKELPYDKSVEFYKYEKNWTNRLIAGDSLLIMNSLLKKEESVSGHVQMIYFDPPYGIKFNSNFQPFVFNQDEKEIEMRPEQIQAFRDTWEYGIHSYLSMMRKRLIVARELLADTGCIFVQISVDNVHRIRCLMDEIFGTENFIWEILFRTTGGGGQGSHPTPYDYILWYAKNKTILKESKKLHQLYLERTDEQLKSYNQVHLFNGSFEKLSKKNEKNGHQCRLNSLFSQGTSSTDRSKPHTFPNGKTITISPILQWRIGHKELDILYNKKRLCFTDDSVYFIEYLKDSAGSKMTNVWEGMLLAGAGKIYTVQTKSKVIERCIALCSDPGDIILDITGGSGTTAYAAEKLGRRWISCDTSKTAINIARWRLMTATYPWYKLKNELLGVCSDFQYETITKLTPKTLTQDNEPEPEPLYDRPIIDKKRTRITGPFTIEGVPSPIVLSGDEQYAPPREEWADKLLDTGISTRSGKRMRFTKLMKNNDDQSPIHYTGINDDNEIAISFGPKHGPLSSYQVEMSIKDAKYLGIDTVLFIGTAFDPEALNWIDNLKHITALAAEVNNDLLINELKNDPGDQSFVLVGKPRIDIIKNNDETRTVKLLGYDYFNPITHVLETGNADDIVLWMLDTDYDGQTLRVEQMFFPTSSESIKKLGKELKHTLRESINEEKLYKYTGNESLPFKIGKNKRIAIKIVDKSGRESMKSIKVGKWE